MAEVILKNVVKVYEGGNLAVDNVSFEIKDKEFVVLVGPSGCGKSTTLRMVAGLEEITSGDLYIDGKRVNDVPPKDRDIAMVFQNYALYPHMTVFDNMAFGLKLRKFKKPEINERVNEAARILGIEELLSRKPKALSGGQRQRVALGRAIVRKPKVFLFDEPLSNLDAKLRVQMRTEISKLHNNLEATMIYVTHDQTEAMTMGDRIVILKDGIVQQIDTPLNLYNHPENKFVAGFIGSPAMNFIKGKIIKQDKLKFTSEGGGLNIILNEEYSSRLTQYVSQDVWMGVRPEDINLRANYSGNGNLNTLNVNLEVVEPMGNEAFLYYLIDNTQFVSRIPARIVPRAGQVEELAIDSEKLYFFDYNTEKTLITRKEE
jgi:multiple sugar transport system ATP-binding protein